MTLVPTTAIPGEATGATWVELTVPASVAYTQVIRLLMSGLGNAAGLNLDEIEDLKLAVGEACYTMFSSVPTDRLALKVINEPSKMVVSIHQEPPPSPGAVRGIEDDGIGSTLIEHLVDRVERTPGRMLLTVFRQNANLRSA